MFAVVEYSALFRTTIWNSVETFSRLWLHVFLTSRCVALLCINERCFIRSSGYSFKRASSFAPVHKMDVMSVELSLKVPCSKLKNVYFNQSMVWLWPWSYQTLSCSSLSPPLYTSLRSEIQNTPSAMALSKMSMGCSREHTRDESFNHTSNGLSRRIRTSLFRNLLAYPNSMLYRSRLCNTGSFCSGPSETTNWSRRKEVDSTTWSSQSWRDSKLLPWLEE